MTHSTSPQARTALASSTTAARDDNATNSPSSSLHPHRSPCPSSLSSSLISPLSSFADRKPPLASKHVNIAPAPWCAPQVHATIAPVSRVSCTSCSTPRHRLSLVDTHSLGHLNYLWTYSFPLRMFSFTIFILDLSHRSFLLAPLLVPLAIGLRPPPLPSTSRSLSRLDTQYIPCF